MNIQSQRQIKLFTFIHNKQAITKGEVLMNKHMKFFALTLLMTILILAAFNANTNVKAQGSATVVFLTSVGGTTNPTGTQSYSDGQTITLTASPTDESFVFQNWVIQADAQSTTVADNPTTLTVSGGVTYAIQAIFIPVQAVPQNPMPADLSMAAYIVILPSAGGTTNPNPGTYALANAAQTQLTATPDEGFEFSHWIISGSHMAGAHGAYPFTANPTDNPYMVDHGYGNVYDYQAVFTPVGTEPTPSIGATATPAPGAMGLTMETWIIAGLVVVIVILLIAFGIYATKRK